MFIIGFLTGHAMANAHIDANAHADNKIKSEKFDKDDKKILLAQMEVIANHIYLYPSRTGNIQNGVHKDIAVWNGHDWSSVDEIWAKKIPNLLEQIRKCRRAYSSEKEIWELYKCEKPFHTAHDVWWDQFMENFQKEHRQNINKELKI